MATLGLEDRFCNSIAGHLGILRADADKPTIVFPKDISVNEANGLYIATCAVGPANMVLSGAMARSSVEAMAELLFVTSMKTYDVFKRVHDEAAKDPEEDDSELTETPPPEDSPVTESVYSARQSNDGSDYMTPALLHQAEAPPAAQQRPPGRQVLRINTGSSAPLQSPVKMLGASMWQARTQRSATPSPSSTFSKSSTIGADPGGVELQGRHDRLARIVEVGRSQQQRDAFGFAQGMEQLSLGERGRSVNR